MKTIAQFAPTALLVVLGLMLVAALRDPVARFLTELFQLVGQQLRVVMGALRKVIKRLIDAEQRVRLGMAEQRPDDKESWAGWDILGALIYLTLFLILALADLYILYLRFSALFHLGPVGSSRPALLEVGAALAWIACTTVWGFVTFDVFGLSPLKGPLLGKVWVRRAATGAFIATLVGGAAFLLWGQGQVTGRPVPALAWLFIALFAVLLHGALVFAGAGIAPGIAAVYALTLIVLRYWISAAALGLEAMLWLFRGMHRTVVRVIDIPASLGRGLWNWIATSKLGKRMRFGRLSEPAELPAIGEDPDQRPSTVTVLALPDGPSELQPELALR